MSHPLYRLFEAVHRQGPGSPEDTERAWAALNPPPVPRIVDMGCGTGAATKVLLSVSGGSVVALDQHAPFLEKLDQWGEAQGLQGRLTTIVGDMAAPPVEEAGFDVVWSEGAAYAIGFETALTTWRSLLVDGGFAAVSELVWRVDDPAPEARAFFEEEYPDMATHAERRATATGCGYRLLDDFMVSTTGWWEGYYRPLLAEIARMEADAPEDEAVAEVAAAVRAEVDIYREHGDSFGYVFLALRKAP